MTPSGRWFRLLPLVCVAALVAGCSSGDSSKDSTGSSAAASSPGREAPAAPSPSTSSAVPAACPNPEGGSCLGRLEPRTGYTTQVLTPSLTYRVPTAGWFNYEDTPGNFLLVPPGSDLPGVNAGTSDFIGVYTAVVPARLAQGGDCVVEPIAGAWTPAKMASWFQHRRNLTSRHRVPIRIGGLHGVSIDLRVAPKAALDSCTDGGQRIRLAGLFTGVTPSSLDHAVIPGMTMRMIMLSWAGNVLAVELDDIDAAPGGLPAITRVARQIRFAP